MYRLARSTPRTVLRLQLSRASFSHSSILRNSDPNAESKKTTPEEKQHLNSLLKEFQTMPHEAHVLFADIIAQSKRFSEGTLNTSDKAELDIAKHQTAMIPFLLNPELRNLLRKFEESVGKDKVDDLYKKLSDPLLPELKFNPGAASMARAEKISTIQKLLGAAILIVMSDLAFNVFLFQLASQQAEQRKQHRDQERGQSEGSDGADNNSTTPTTEQWNEK